MKRSTEISIRLITLLTLLCSVSQAVDVLYSQRLTKRGLDAAGNFNISFFHVNDVHAHLDEFSSSGTDCTRPDRGCFGGYARIKHVLQTQRPQYNDALWLNVGDEFQGTLFYSYYGGEKIAETLNQLNFSAMTLGNHEFDGGDEKLGQFLENLTFPIVSANVHSQNEKVNKSVKPYHIFEKQGIAIIGVTTEDTSSISNADDTTTFSSAVEAVQGAINEIKRITNITRIAAITHIGYDKDQELAAATSGLQLIMGGHSHTLLGDMEKASGKYPTIVKNKDGDEVFIVTAYRWGEYVGYIDVTYNSKGKILAYHGAPIHITNTTEQDKDLQSQIKAWRGPFEAFAAEVVGISNVELDQTTCQQKECTLGNCVADAMYDYRKNNSQNVAFALVNAGGLRATINEGNITRGEILTAFPFGNAVVEIALSGEDLWKVIEGLVSKINVNNKKEVTSFFQVSKGIKIQYNPQNANFSKLVSVKINNQEINNSTKYDIVTLDFLASGGDNIFTATKDFVSLDTLDEVLVGYVKRTSPVNASLEGRIEQVNGQKQPIPSATSSGARPSQTGEAARGRSGVIGATILAILAGAVLLC